MPSDCSEALASISSQESGHERSFFSCYFPLAGQARELKVSPTLTPGALDSVDCHHQAGRTLAGGGTRYRKPRASGALTSDELQAMTRVRPGGRVACIIPVLCLERSTITQFGFYIEQVQVMRSLPSSGLVWAGGGGCWKQGEKKRKSGL